jgi:hypothetical protein
MERNGHCSCGKVKFCVQGEPINAVFCYCTDCQIATGSDKFYGVWFKPNQFTLLQGNVTKFNRNSDSGYEITFMFCECCGTTVCGDSTYGIVTVAGATLDSTDGIEPKMAIFTKSAPKWALLPTDIPCFETDQID